MAPSGAPLLSVIQLGRYNMGLRRFWPLKFPADAAAYPAGQPNQLLLLLFGRLLWLVDRRDSNIFWTTLIVDDSLAPSLIWDTDKNHSNWDFSAWSQISWIFRELPFRAKQQNMHYFWPKNHQTRICKMIHWSFLWNIPQKQKYRQVVHVVHSLIRLSCLFLSII